MSRVFYKIMETVLRRETPGAAGFASRSPGAGNLQGLRIFIFPFCIKRFNAAAPAAKRQPPWGTRFDPEARRTAVCFYTRRLRLSLWESLRRVRCERWG